MRNLAGIALCMILFLRCGDGQQQAQMPVSVESRIDGTQLAEKLPVNPEARDLLDDWQEFLELENSMDKLYRVENREDLRLLLDEILEKENAVGEGEKPPLFDKPQIYSRTKVLKTYLLKAKAHLEYHRDPTEALQEMMEAYNALRREFNVLTNNTLETDLISDE